MIAHQDFSHFFQIWNRDFCFYSLFIILFYSYFSCSTLLLYSFQIVDTIPEIGVDAFLHPDYEVSFSHSKNIPEGEKGTLLLYQRSNVRDEITSISESNNTLSDLDKRKKFSGISLWCACFEFEMFSIGREEGVRQLGLGLFEERGVDRDRGSKDSDMERTQRMIVMECALAAGLGSVLSEYVLAQADTSNSLSKGM
jgi:hypothetical protein